MTIADVEHQIGVKQMYGKLYAGVGRSQPKRLLGLEKERQRLRQAGSDLTLDEIKLNDPRRGKF